MTKGEPALACKACQQVVIRDEVGQLHCTGYYPDFFQKKVRTQVFLDSKKFSPKQTTFKQQFIHYLNVIYP